MGLLHVNTEGSFPAHRRTWSAREHGHAHAVAAAIAYLVNEVLPEAIERDHRLHAQGKEPSRGFDRPRDADGATQRPRPEHDSTPTRENDRRRT